MTPNDTQIDVLLRRYARQAKTESATKHLDADELNAFAEGALPPGTRSLYVAHLADCDDCRKIVAQLTGAAGAANAVAIEGSQRTEPGLWWERLRTFFAPPTLRYAAFAVVLVAAAGVTLLALRQPRQSTLVAGNQRSEQTEVAVAKEYQQPATPANKDAAATAKGSSSVSQPAESTKSDLKRQESNVAVNTAPASQPEKEPAAVAANPVVPPKKVAEPSGTETRPSFAPPPPGETERAKLRSRDSQSLGGITAAGPRKDEASTRKLGEMDQTRVNEPRDRRSADEVSRAATSPSAISGRRVEQKSAASRREPDSVTVTSENSNKVSVQALRDTPRPAPSPSPTELAPEIRAVGGRKFRRQGNAWVDTKFKSSMSVKNISRGTDDYSALDGKIRSIAEQLGGEVIVMWKGKAYLIR